MQANERTAFLKDLDRVINQEQAALRLRSGVVYRSGHLPVLYVVNCSRTKRSAEIGCELDQDEAWGFTWDRANRWLGPADKPVQVAHKISRQLNAGSPEGAS